MDNKPQFDSKGVIFSVSFWGFLIFCILFVVGYVFLRILKGLASSSIPFSSKIKSIIYLAVGVIAIYFTWTHMILMTQDDIKASGFGDFYTWFVSKKTHREHSLFFVAYKSVSDTPEGWWFSAQVLLFVLAMIVYFAIESSSNHNIKFSFAIVWLGFGVAISACIPVFFSYILVSAISKPKDVSSRYGVNWLLLICEILATISLIIIPITEGNFFNRNIIFGHVIMMVPLMVPNFLFKPGKSPAIDFAKIAMMYGLIAGISLVYHLNATANIFVPSVLGKQGTSNVTLQQAFINQMNVLIEKGWAHHAQASISYDLVFITIECCLYFILEGGFVGILYALFTPFFSVATTFPAFLVWKEFKHYRSQISDEKKKQ